MLTRVTCLFLFVVSFVVVCPAATFAETGAGDNLFWEDHFKTSRPDQFVDAIVEHDGYLYVGGNFKHVGDLRVNYFARWDGEKWEKVGEGVGNAVMGVVHDLELDAVHDRLYVAGMFDVVGSQQAPNIAYYDTKLDQWGPLGDGVDRASRGIAIAANGDVYAVGEFTTADRRPAQAVARWNGNAWSSLNGSLNPRARAVAVTAVGNDIYVGGFFNTAGGVSASNIARWTGSKFVKLSSGTNGLVTEIVEHEGDIYVAGLFTKAGPVLANSIARWDGSQWYAIGDGLSGPGGAATIRAINIDAEGLLVGGAFTRSGTTPIDHVARWDGTQWNPLGTGANGEVKVIREYMGVYYVGGDFTSVGGMEASHLARWIQPPSGAVSVDQFEVRADQGSVVLDWRVGGTEAPAGYRVYRRDLSGGVETLVTEEDLPGVATRFVDRNATFGKNFDYQLAIVRPSGAEYRSQPRSVRVSASRIDLQQNFPNPFNPVTTIRFILPTESPVRLAIYDVAGRVVRTLIDKQLGPGVYSPVWNGMSDAGKPAATGVYFYRLEADGFTESKKMILVK